jgi:hypothetical protein
MQITLYKAAEEVRALLEQVDETTGELPEGLEHARAIVAAKSQAVAAYVLDEEARIDMVKSHVKALQERVKTAAARTDKLREYLADHMKACGIHEIKSNDGTFHAKLELERDKSVDVFDEKQLPKDYLREVPASYSPDKKLIKQALDDGFDVPGARIATKDRLTLK